MRQIEDVDYSQYYYYKPKPEKSKAIQRPGVRIAAVICIALCFVGFILLSVGTKAPDGVSYHGKSGVVTAEELAFYAVELGRFSLETDAAVRAGQVRARGGAGYVWSNTDRHYAIAAIYAKKSDAQSVKAQLTAAGEDAAVLELAWKKCVWQMNGKAQAQAFAAGVLFFRQTAAVLEEMSLGLDTTTQDVGAAQKQLSQLAEQAAGLAGSGREELDSGLSAANASLTEAAAEPGSSVQLSAAVKHCAAVLLDEYRKLVDMSAPGGV